MVWCLLASIHNQLFAFECIWLFLNVLKRLHERLSKILGVPHVFDSNLHRFQWIIFKYFGRPGRSSSSKPKSLLQITFGTFAQLVHHKLSPITMTFGWSFLYIKVLKKNYPQNYFSIYNMVVMDLIYGEELKTLLWINPNYPLKQNDQRLVVS